MSQSLELPVWSPTYPVRGDLDFVRVSASTLAAVPLWSCPELLAYKARPAAYVDLPYGQSARSEYQDFPLGLVRDVVLQSLGAIGFQGGPAGSPADALEQQIVDKNWAPSSLQAVKAAINGYYAVVARFRQQAEWTDAKFASNVIAADAGIAPTSPGRETPTSTEWFAWGIHVVRDGQRIRETHLLRWRGAGNREAVPARLAVVARNLAEGFFPTGSSKWGQPFVPMPSQPNVPERLIVREIGLLDSTEAVLFDGTPAEALARFAAEVPQMLPLLMGGVGHPGGRCAGCAVLPLCPHPSRSAGILGVAGRAGWMRPVTPGDLSAHALCPAAVHYRRDLGLPKLPAETGLAGQRGTLVHAWLAAAHDRGVPCTDEDLPREEFGEVADELGWSVEQYELARPYLLQHPDGCPLADDEVGEVSSEQDVTVVDSDANVVFATRLDFAAQLGVAGRLIRETKTINPAHLPDDEPGLIQYFPQIAFPIVALAAGIDPLTGASTGAPIPGRVELELLHADFASVVQFDVSDPEIVQYARVSLAQDADLLINDVEHRPQPGAHCRWCDVRDWCTAKSLVDIELAKTVSPGGDEAEWAGTADRMGTLALIARAVSQENSGLDEDLPF